MATRLGSHHVKAPAEPKNKAPTTPLLPRSPAHPDDPELQFKRSPNPIKRSTRTKKRQNTPNRVAGRDPKRKTPRTARRQRPQSAEPRQDEQESKFCREQGLDRREERAEIPMAKSLVLGTERRQGFNPRRAVDARAEGTNAVAFALIYGPDQSARGVEINSGWPRGWIKPR